MPTYIIFSTYLQYFKKIYNESAQLEMVSQRDRRSQEFAKEGRREGLRRFFSFVRGKEWSHLKP